MSRFLLFLLIWLPAAACLTMAQAAPPANHQPSAPVSIRQNSPGTIDLAANSHPVGLPASVISTPLSAVGSPLLESSMIEPVQPVAVKTTKTSPEKPTVAQRRAWWVLATAQHGSAAFDAWSTRQSISSGRGRELNPLAKPFAGSAAIYPALQVMPVGMDYLSRRMMRSSNRFARKTWWLPQALATTGFVVSGVRNLQVANMR